MVKANKVVLALVISAVLGTTLTATAGAQIESTREGSAVVTQRGIAALRLADPNLTGRGVKFAVVCRSITYIDGEPQNDYIPYTEHNCLRAKEFVFHDEGKLPAGISPHSTAICSILFGDDPNAFYPNLGSFTYKGTTPEATAEVYEFWHFLINHVFPQRPPDADVLTASVGALLEDWWTRGIEAMAEHYGLVVVAGIGNGLEAKDPVLYPGASANVIGVGVVDTVDANDLLTRLEYNSLAYPEHSSFGPTEDGRCKPDIVAVGNCLAAEVNEPNAYGATGNWSSFATPVVAGTIGLLVQKAGQEPNLALALSPDGGNCVFKAIVMNSAWKLPYWHKGRLGTDDDHQSPLDYIQGAGILNPLGAYNNLVAGPQAPGTVGSAGWNLGKLEQGNQTEDVYSVEVPEPNDKFITATLVWNRHYSDTYPFEPLLETDVDLRLELWGLDSENPQTAYLLDYSDSSADNVEHIYWPLDANYTSYQLVVSVNDLPETSPPGQPEPYALAWSVREKQPVDEMLALDLNADGVINSTDLVIALENIRASLTGQGRYILGDVNGDGLIDLLDFRSFLLNCDRTAPWYGQQRTQTDTK